MSATLDLDLSKSFKDCPDRFGAEVQPGFVRSLNVWVKVPYRFAPAVRLDDGNPADHRLDGDQ